MTLAVAEALTPNKPNQYQGKRDCARTQALVDGLIDKVNAVPRRVQLKDTIHSGEMGLWVE